MDGIDEGLSQRAKPLTYPTAAQRAPFLSRVAVEDKLTKNPLHVLAAIRHHSET